MRFGTASSDSTDSATAGRTDRQRGEGEVPPRELETNFTPKWLKQGPFVRREVGPTRGITDGTASAAHPVRR